MKQKASHQAETNDRWAQRSFLGVVEMAVDTSQFQSQITAHKVPGTDHPAGCEPSQGGYQDIAGEELNRRGNGEKLADQ